MNTPLVERPEHDASEAFAKMVERIRKNADQPFGGACVIVPPANAGEPIELLILDASSHAAQFWASITARIQMQLTELEQKQLHNQTFGGMRR